MTTPVDVLGRLRAFELERALQHLAGSHRILELGGGSGFQARRLADLGYQVRSLDVSRDRGIGIHFPVAAYDGRSIPFEDSAFDCVFSSNVLEHVEDFTALMAECRRVLRPGGHMIHIMPSTSWRAWTIASHYAYLLKAIATLGDSLRSTGEPGLADRYRRRGLFSLASRALFPGPHGEFRNALAELSEYGVGAWTRRFQAAGWQVEATQPLGLFYTGYAIFPNLSMERRSAWSRVLGSSTILYRVVPRT